MAVSSVVDGVGTSGRYLISRGKHFEKSHVSLLMLMQVKKGSNCSFFRKGMHCKPASPSFFSPLIWNRHLGKKRIFQLS